MVDGADWKPQAFHAMWAKFRAVFVSVGLMDNVAEIDEIAANGAMMLGAPDTWWHVLTKALERVTVAVSTVDPPRASAAIPAMRELCGLIDHQEEMRRALSRAYVATWRGVAYCQFLLAAQMKLQDGALSAMAPYIPATVLRAADLDIRDAASAPDVERRTRALAGATRTLMESYYKPILTGVWTLSALMVGKSPKKPPGQIGGLFHELRKTLWPLLPAPWPEEFIDEDAKYVRNAAAHSNVRFDAAADELVLSDHGKEQRLTEPQLRERFGNVFVRAETMRAAFLYATGKLESNTD